MKKIINKRIIAFILIAIMLVTMSVCISARFGMGGVAVKIGSTTVGNGYIWSVPDVPEFRESTESTMYDNVTVRLNLHVTSPISGTLYGNPVSDTDGYVEASLPASGATSNDYGYGYHKVGSSAEYGCSAKWNG